MKENCRKVTSCPFYSLFLALLAVLLMGIPAVSVQAAGVKTPGKVNITSVKMTGNNKVTINWKKASNATKYRIYYKQSGARSWKAIADVSSGKTSYTHTSNNRNPLAGGKKYVYTVRAYNKTSRKWGTYDKNGKGMFGETIANPALTVLDIELFAKVAHAHGVPLVVDNTFPTPVNCRPFEWGADIVTHSTTKYMDGHGAALGGAIVDSGNFDWMAHADKYPGLCTPDESYHGITYAEKFGKEGAFITKCTAQLMRNFGSMQSPNNAFILNLGLESLHVRMPKHVENGQAVAEFLEKHPKVAYVNYPGLPSNKYYERAQKYLPNGGCGVVSFGLKGGREAASTFMQNLKLGAIETHVADARTCCLNPATSTHRQMTDEQLIEAGVPAELIRISLGLEDKEDLIADISNALDAIK